MLSDILRTICTDRFSSYNPNKSVERLQQARGLTAYNVTGVWNVNSSETSNGNMTPLTARARQRWSVVWAAFGRRWLLRLVGFRSAEGDVVCSEGCRDSDWLGTRDVRMSYRHVLVSTRTVTILIRPGIIIARDGRDCDTTRAAALRTRISLVKIWLLVRRPIVFIAVYFLSRKRRRYNVANGRSRLNIKENPVGNFALI